jgi:NAD(P)-dependent dehydrogenase (short-subunit alcohol dehydrogenase family)
MRRRTPPSVAGQVVAITGGARGIGLATAQAFLQAGARVAIGDIDRAALDAARENLELTALSLDVTSERSFADFLAEVERRLGPVDVLVNNAGVMPVGPVTTYDDELCSRVVEIDLLGVIRGSRLVAESMIGRRRGHIVNIASFAGRVAAPGLSLYNAAKFGVVGFSEALGAELISKNVRVSTVLPSITDTGLIDGLRGSVFVRPSSPDQVAAAVVGLVGSDRQVAVVPAVLGPISVAAMILPPRAKRYLLSRPSYAKLFLEPDVVGRRDYETRANLYAR